ncbi:hypothetical protein ABFS82_04G164400 [Erythranthe guttata]|uniref:TORTIFOLIA1/SINE1-2 N-terminal domain-containing protein n=1 Tax=Erythranthe guttata TaxID=4155 RepID=A0A022QEU2_ERYGU|nr:PREDICTED: microtubule-associated protein TORTIFOLIA1-like [Erythranthe guttata]EYU26441.1 hypothetical protein MIMGU_mgv1a003603mg [Erythranthe guttata]|eukprot:XP_012850487.1 PREDICTED: microtubule-associated protein TORTIFOLIA1-like [Erythranthe guttata]
MSGLNSGKQATARALNHRVLTCLHKLSDRDTHSAAASELDSIAKTLSAAALPPFVSSIAATDSSDKSPVRRQCLRLVSVLSEHHGNSLSPHHSKLLSAVVRRLRDPDSSIRAACVAASLSLSSNLTSLPFTSISKPFLDSLFSEQDPNAQNGAALCSAAIIEGSKNPDAAALRRLLPRLEKLVKSEGFKAKPSLLSLIGSAVGVKGVLNNGGKSMIGNSIACLVEFLSSEDWASRKAAAEALTKIATAAAGENDALSEHKASCLKTFESKRFDKVKATRETMNKMIEAWKEIPDLPQLLSAPPESEDSSKENGSNERDPQFTDQPRKRTPLGPNENKVGPGIFRKLDPKKPSVLNEEIIAQSRSNKYEQDLKKPDIKRALFNDVKQKKLGLFKGGSRVVPCGDDGVVFSNETGDNCRNQNRRECEDLSLIRKQLLQIENQQSSLFDLLQRFIGSSQNSMNSLETRVHGLELALDEISFDLALSNGRVSRNSSNAGSMCCKVPGTEFLSSKLWRKAEARYSASRFPASGDNIEGSLSENRRHLLRGGRGLIMNPLAKKSAGFSNVLSDGVVYSSVV